MAAKKPFEATGALPNPAELKEYENIIPDSAKALLDSFLKESDHRRAQEQKQLDADIRFKQIGQIFGLIIALAAIIGGSTAASKGEPLAGGAIGCGGLFILGVVNLLARLCAPLPNKPPEDTTT